MSGMSICAAFRTSGAHTFFKMLQSEQVTISWAMNVQGHAGNNNLSFHTILNYSFFISSRDQLLSPFKAKITPIPFYNNCRKPRHMI